MDVKHYHLPSTPQEYRPDQSAVVDRWLQASNASNAATTAAIVADLAGPGIVALVDPFAGGGSTAAAARTLDLPFLGIELDPVLVCATLAKTLSGPEHADLLARQPGAPTPETLLTWLGEATADLDPQNKLIVKCLGLTQIHSGTLGFADLAADLRAVPRPVSASRMVWGDSADPASWRSIGQPRGHVVVYTSPPFGSSSPRLVRSATIQAAAEKILVESDVNTTTSSPGEFPAFIDATMLTVRHALEFFERATVIIEHENGDDGTDSRRLVADTLDREPSGRVSEIRLFETIPVSRRGPLSFIVCELSR